MGYCNRLRPHRRLKGRAPSINKNSLTATPQKENLGVGFKEVDHHPQDAIGLSSGLKVILGGQPARDHTPSNQDSVSLLYTVAVVHDEGAATGEG